MGGYLSLFAAAVLAATLFPAQSEALLVALLLNESYSVLALIGVASVGNTLGSIINWFLGRSLERFKSRAWFPVKADTLARAQEWYHRYGKWSLLASWLPIIGDPITLVAGVMKEPLPIFILLVGIAKTARYSALAAVTTGLT
jgi:membrane protein YqaA with SNARE-associated domain